MEYVKNIYERYHKAAKQEKSKILEEMCRVCGCHRKHAIRLLGKTAQSRQPIRRERKSLYSAECVRILQEIWHASGFVCSQRLKEIIVLWMPHIRDQYHPSAQLERQLQSISARQIENRLRAHKGSVKKRVYRTTRPGSLLKSQIPIRTMNWDITKPGYLEIDLVAHCGNSNAGEFIYTLDATDIQTGWVERVAVLGKSQHKVLEGVRQIKEALPMQLCGIDSDNGDEFINYQLLNFCTRARPQIQFTRARAYRKNDNAYIEQKNWTHVRKIFAWDRYDEEKALQAMNQLYSDELRLFQNLFQPSLKLRQKTRVGSKVVRHYDKPKTPLQRLKESGRYHRVKMKQLQQLFKTLNPFDLSRRIDEKIQKIYRLSSQKIKADAVVKLKMSPAQKNARRWMKNYFFTRQVRRRINRMETAKSKPFVCR
jgi:hypothetical protein